MQPLRKTVLALLLVGTASGLAQADDTFRCGNVLVELGMTQAQVLERCGEPTSKSETTEPVRSGPQVVGTTTVSRWTYASYSATRVLEFDGDKLRSID
jgi:hypothetical protein